MIKKNNERTTDIRTNMRGGPGEVKIKHYFKKDEINASCRLCAELKLAPGAGIGLHAHENEDEIFIIGQGKGLVIDDEEEVQVEAGDAILTGKGARHAIKNIGDNDLLITAIIIQY